MKSSLAMGRRARMAHDVFVSYASKDHEIAGAACAALEGAGLKCWIAPRDAVPGIDWGESIVDAISGCKIMVLVFSAHANESPQIKREVERAVSGGAIVIPLRIENIVPTKAMAYYISAAHWLDAYTPPLQQHLDYLVQTVKAVLQGATPRPAPGPGPRPSRRAAHPADPAASQKVSWKLLFGGMALAFVSGAAFWYALPLLQKRPAVAEPAEVVAQPALEAPAPRAPAAASAPAAESPAAASAAPAIDPYWVGRWWSEVNDGHGQRRICELVITPDGRYRSSANCPEWNAQSGTVHLFRERDDRGRLTLDGDDGVQFVGHYRQLTPTQLYVSNRHTVNFTRG